MKAKSIIKKNFKLLLRSKASAFIILVGPLLIILLVGLVFSGQSSYGLSIGYYTPTHNNLTNAFVDSLKQSDYYVQEFKDEESCVRKIEQGIIHTCIIFPEDFKISNEQKNELRFLVDYSKMNLVYKVIDSVSGILDVESKELSQSLTQVLLSRINATIKDIENNLVIVGGIESNLNTLSLDIQRAKTNTENMKLDMREVRVSSIKTRFSALNKTISDLREKGVDLINESREYIEVIKDDAGWSDNETDELEKDFNKLKNQTIELHNLSVERIQSVITAIDGVSSSLEKLESDLNRSKELNEVTKEKLDSAKSTLASIQNGFTNLKNALEKSKKRLEDIAITKAETIVSPVNTKIEPVVSETSKLTFTFPFLLVLVIMFVALLLSSSLIMVEKHSKAFFRNFITPTRPFLFVITTFLTSFIVVILQTIIILGLANYFLHIPLLKNALLTILIIFVTITFFIILGMAVGYLFSTQEGAIMVSIVLGSLFMFLSNLVVPLESLAPFFSKIIGYNPYVIASDLLRKSLLFTVNINETIVIILILFGASVVIFLLIALFHGLMGVKKIKEPKEALGDSFTKQKEGSSSKSATKTEAKDTPSAHTLAKLELFKQVSNMTKAEFEENINLKENKIANTVERRLGDKKLAHKLRKTTSRKEILKILAEEIKKEKRKKNPAK